MARTSNNIFLRVAASIFVLINLSSAITTTHHDKPIGPPSNLMQHAINTADTIQVENMTTTAATTVSSESLERQRRLIPYTTFYLAQDFNNPQQYNLLPQKNHNLRPYNVLSQKLAPSRIPPYAYEHANIGGGSKKTVYQPDKTYTPFLDSNKLPGGFTPMLRPPITYSQLAALPQPQQQYQPINKVPNYSAIYDKLAQYKQLVQQQMALGVRFNPVAATPQQQQQQPTYIPIYKIRRPISYIPIPPYADPPQSQYKQNLNQLSPTKTFVQSYVPDNNNDLPNNIPQTYDTYEQLKNSYRPQEEIPINAYEPYEPLAETYRPIVTTKTATPAVKYNYETVTPNPIYIHNENSLTQLLKGLPQNSPSPQVFPPSLTDTRVVPTPPDNPNTLSHLLKALQYSNTLPHRFTHNNIDNSIKTLVHILNALKHQKIAPVGNEPSTAAPVELSPVSPPVPTPSVEHVYEDDEEGAEPEAPIHVHEVPNDLPGHSGPLQDHAGTITQVFPAQTLEGGTPGKPGIDYPTLSTIPETEFSCKMQRYKGFFGDPETKCQVWHYCDLNGGQASFLCPNGTIFSQVALTCDWWYNVKCSSTPQLYVLNERLYKYILPFTPKFPEDYTGPLVDKYLTEKFKEMEAKMNRQKKGKGKPPTLDDVTESDELQDIDAKPSAATQTETTESAEK